MEPNYEANHVPDVLYRIFKEIPAERLTEEYCHLYTLQAAQFLSGGDLYAFNNASSHLSILFKEYCYLYVMEIQLQQGGHSAVAQAIGHENTLSIWDEGRLGRFLEKDIMGNPPLDIASELGGLQALQLVHKKFLAAFLAAVNHMLQNPREVTREGRTAPPPSATGSAAARLREEPAAHTSLRQRKQPEKSWVRECVDQLPDHSDRLLAGKVLAHPLMLAATLSVIKITLLPRTKKSVMKDFGLQEFEYENVRIAASNKDVSEFLKGVAKARPTQSAVKELSEALYNVPDPV